MRPTATSSAAWKRRAVASGSRRVLVFSPHPDDDIIGLGGRLAHHARSGDFVETVYMTSGEAGDIRRSPAAAARVRKEEARKAARVIGISKVSFLGLPDGGVPSSGPVLDRITRLIRLKKPHVVYFPHAGDGHPDHRRTHELVREAVSRSGVPCFPRAGKGIWTPATVLCYEVWTPLSEFSFVEDISDVIELKIRALACHASQLRAVRYDDAVRSLNRFRGVMTGIGRYCECFQVLRASGL